MTQIVNIRNDNCDNYIGRGSLWGNPFTIANHGTRPEVIKMYKTYIYGVLLHDISYRKSLVLLRDKNLGCYCKPLDCHGDILKDLLDRYGDEQILNFNGIDGLI